MSTNLFKQFRRLIPVAPLQVGAVLSVAEGEAVVELPGGTTLRARGAAVVGQRVWVRDGVIEGTAPNLPVEIIEI